MKHAASSLCILILLQSICSIGASSRSYYGDEYVTLGRWSNNNNSPPGTQYSTQQQLTALLNSQQSIVNESQNEKRALRQNPSLLARLGRRKQRQRHSRDEDTNTVIDSSEEDENNVVLCASAKKQKSARHFARLGGPLRKQPQQEPQEESFVDSTILHAITLPIIPQEVWYSLVGDEFVRHGERLDDLVRTGEQLARFDESNEWIDWHVKHSCALPKMKEGEIQVWTGKSKREGYGSGVPWIKTRSVVPMTPDEMIELLMDSDRVQTYNPWSLGRKDTWINDDDESVGMTKIVKNKTQPPIGKKAMVAITLLHARPLSDGAWIFVSRAIGGRLYRTPQDDECGKSDIMLGVNLVEPLDDDDESSILTAVTHVYSSAMPAMLAERLGVKSAIKFVKDMRALKVPA